jgi:glyoxylase-like metal-dependent hydrolase (beta-lactamase superfamily II)
MPPGDFRSPRRRRCLIGALTVLALALVLFVAYRGRPSPAVHEPATTPSPAGGPFLEPRPVTLAPGLHLLGDLAPAAAYVVETPSGLVLIDSGIETDGRSLKEQMRSLGLDWRRTRAILLTHAHGDHSGGAAGLARATGATVYAGAGDAAVLRAGEPREAFYSSFALPQGMQPVPTRVDVELRGGETIEVGNARFQVLAAPGHSPGSICYLLTRSARRVLFSGDVIMSLSVNDRGRSLYSRPLGTYPAYLAPRYRGDARAFLRTFRSLRAMPAPDLVLPGHPRDDRTPQSPVMTQDRWAALLDRGIREMEQLLQRYERDGALFLDDRPKKLLRGCYYLGDCKGVAVYGFFAASRFFLVNAPGGPGLRAFVVGRLAQLGLEPTKPSAVFLTSANAAAAAGLEGLLGGGTCRVVAPAVTRKAIEHVCPPGTTIIEPEELSRRSGCEVKAITTGGPGGGSIAYLVRWEGKSVLFSGPLPLKPLPAASKETLRETVLSLGTVGDFRDALDRLRAVKPDLWLPAVPANGQNANLDVGEWSLVLSRNEDLIR